MSLRTSRERFEGLGLQAKQRPAACRRTLRLRQKYQNARASGHFVFYVERAMSLRTSREILVCSCFIQQWATRNRIKSLA